MLGRDNFKSQCSMPCKREQMEGHGTAPSVKWQSNFGSQIICYNVRCVAILLLVQNAVWAKTPSERVVCERQGAQMLAEKIIKTLPVLVP